MSKTLNMSDAIIGNTIALSMVVTLMAAPLIGSISDQTGKRLPYLIFYRIYGECFYFYSCIFNWFDIY